MAQTGFQTQESRGRSATYRDESSEDLEVRYAMSPECFRAFSKSLGSKGISEIKCYICTILKHSPLTTVREKYRPAQPTFERVLRVRFDCNRADIERTCNVLRQFEVWPIRDEGWFDVYDALRKSPHAQLAGTQTDFPKGFT